MTNRKKDKTETPGTSPLAKEERTKEQCKPQATTTTKHKATNVREAQRLHNHAQPNKKLTVTHKLLSIGNPIKIGKTALTVHINGTLPTLTPTHSNGPTNNKTGIELGELLLPPHPALTQQEVIKQATHNLLQAEAALQHPQPATETTLTTATFSNAIFDAHFIGLLCPFFDLPPVLHSAPKAVMMFSQASFLFRMRIQCGVSPVSPVSPRCTNSSCTILADPRVLFTQVNSAWEAEVTCLRYSFRPCVVFTQMNLTWEVEVNCTSSLSHQA